ncbi:uncharacterized protein LOC113324479 [Papaver somniferum]|uniref:uncharacterized protein LOC113324479 n=1 Tax=Papaver somniferum TaxID=3469 RepID=UPI000E6FBC9D|nr:uncharacterized protein LOC113324479 [Papaver somniferum]
MVISLCGRNFQDKSADEGYRFLHEVAEKTLEWDVKEPIIKSIPNKSGVHRVDIKFDSDAKIAAMARRIESLEQSQFSSKPFVEHSFDDNVREKANALYQDNRQRFEPYSNTYNPGWSRHPNSSWSKGQYQDQPSINMSSGFTQTDPSLVESLKLLTHNTLQLSQDMRQFAQFQQNSSQFQQTTQRSITNLEHQIGQLSSQLNARDKGTFPNQPRPSAKATFEVNQSGFTPSDHVHAITTLRSGRLIGNQDPNLEENEKVRDSSSTTQDTPSNNNEISLNEKDEPEVSYIPRAPFPQILLPKTKETQNSEILEVFKQVKVNILLLDAIRQIPPYATVLKDLCTVKRRLNVKKKSFLIEQVSSIITYNTPPKYKDPGCSTISCVIGDQAIKHALVDLGASVNLLPYCVYKQLGLGELKPTSVTLRLVDRSIYKST